MEDKELNLSEKEKMIIHKLIIRKEEEKEKLSKILKLIDKKLNKFKKELIKDIKVSQSLQNGNV